MDETEPKPKRGRQRKPLRPKWFRRRVQEFQETMGVDYRTALRAVEESIAREKEINDGEA